MIFLIKINCNTYSIYEANGSTLTGFKLVRNTREDITDLWSTHRNCSYRAVARDASFKAQCDIRYSLLLYSSLNMIHVHWEKRQKHHV